MIDLSKKDLQIIHTQIEILIETRDLLKNGLGDNRTKVLSNLENSIAKGREFLQIAKDQEGNKYKGVLESTFDMYLEKFNNLAIDEGYNTGEEMFHDLYWAQEQTMNKLAHKFAVSTTTINLLLQHFNIPKRRAGKKSKYN